MKQTQTSNINTETQTGTTLASGAAALPVRRGQAFGGRLLLKPGIVALLLGASLLGAVGQPAQPHYRFTEIPVPGPAYAFGINDRGLVTGFYTDPATSNVLSFVLEGGVLTTGIAAPGATVTSLGPANNRGVEIGNFGDLTHQQAGFYDIHRGTFSTLPEIPGMPFSFGDGINDFGHASGVAYVSGDFNNGGNGLGLNWVWDGESYSFFTVPGAVNGAAAGGINNRDQVAGYYVDSSGLPKGFLKDGQNFTTIAAPGAIYTIVLGINNLGVVAGEYVDASHVHHGLLWRNGQFVTVDVTIPGALGNEWYQANDQGDLAGVYVDATGMFRAVIAERVDADVESDDAQ